MPGHFNEYAQYSQILEMTGVADASLNLAPSAWRFDAFCSLAFGH